MNKATSDALSDAVDILRQHPVLFVAGAVNATVVLPGTVLSILGIPVLSRPIEILAFFIFPFVLAGTIGMAYEGLSGGTAFGTFTEIGKRRYLSMLAGSLIQTVITAVFGIMVLIGFVLAAAVNGEFTGILDIFRGLIWFGFFFVLAVAESGVEGVMDFITALDPVVPLTVVAIGGPILLAYLAVMFLIQFFPVAIVVENRGAIESLKRSYAVVRANLVPALGYSAIVSMILSFIFLMTTIPTAVVGPLTNGGGSTMTPVGGNEAAVGIVGTLVAAVVVYTFQQAFATAFYVRHAIVDTAGDDRDNLNAADD